MPAALQVTADWITKVWSGNQQPLTVAAIRQPTLHLWEGKDAGRRASSKPTGSSRTCQHAMERDSERIKGGELLGNSELLMSGALQPSVEQI